MERNRALKRRIQCYPFSGLFSSVPRYFLRIWEEQERFNISVIKLSDKKVKKTLHVTVKTVSIVFNSNIFIPLTVENSTLIVCHPVQS